MKKPEVGTAPRLGGHCPDSWLKQHRSGLGLGSGRATFSSAFAVAAFQDLLTDFLSRCLDFLHLLAHARAGGLIPARGLVHIVRGLIDKPLERFVFRHCCLQNVRIVAQKRYLRGSEVSIALKKRGSKSSRHDRRTSFSGPATSVASSSRHYRSHPIPLLPFPYPPDVRKLLTINAFDAAIHTSVVRPLDALPARPRAV